MRRRVVVTGLGAVTPIGIGVEKSWKALCEGKSGIATITRFDTTKFRTKIAGEIRGLEPLDYMDQKTVRRTDRFIHIALVAAQLAFQDAGLATPLPKPERVGVVVGTALGGLENVGKIHELILAGRNREISPFFLSSFICNEASTMVAMQVGARGPNTCSVTACAAGAHAIGEAFRTIQGGEADIMFAGGAEAPIHTILVAGLDAVRVSSPKSAEPQKACRPFEKNRDGLIAAEGAGILVLEELKAQVCQWNCNLERCGLVALRWGNVSGFDREKGPGDSSRIAHFRLNMSSAMGRHPSFRDDRPIRMVG